MRWIRKPPEPRALTEWRALHNSDVNFGYALLRSSQETIRTVTDALLREQGGLCAYTGIRIAMGSCHIEHLKAQAHCSPAETVLYSNLVACHPSPNPRHKTPYGAEQKGNWPDPSEQHLFVSPLDRTCEKRFAFTLRGGIREQADGDQAAKTTIERIGLDHPELVAFRRAAIQGTLGRRNNLPLRDARRRLNFLRSHREGRREPFCFVLIQALQKHIVRLEAIAETRRRRA